MSTNKVLLGALAGLAAGAILGILLAPEKGSETRKKIINKSNDCLADVKDKVDEIVDNLQEQVDIVKAKVREAEAKINQRVKEAEQENATEVKA